MRANPRAQWRICGMACAGWPVVGQGIGERSYESGWDGSGRRLGQHPQNGCGFLSCGHQLRWLLWKVCSVASGGIRGMWVPSDAWHRGLRVRLSGLSLKLRPQICTVWNEALPGMSFLRFMAIPVWCRRQLRSEYFDLSSCQLQYDPSWDRRDECWLYRRPRLPEKLLLQLVPRGPRGPVFLFPSAARGSPR